LHAGTATGRISLAASMPVAKSRFACTVVGGRIYVMGGLQMRGGR